MLTGFPRTRWPRLRFSESYAVRISVKISRICEFRVIMGIMTGLLGCCSSSTLGSRANDYVKTLATLGFWLHHSPCSLGCWTNNTLAARSLSPNYALTGMLSYTKLWLGIWHTLCCDWEVGIHYAIMLWLGSWHTLCYYAVTGKLAYIMLWLGSWHTLYCDWEVGIHYAVTEKLAYIMLWLGSWHTLCCDWEVDIHHQVVLREMDDRGMPWNWYDELWYGRIGLMWNQ